jgi:serine/threonine protein kinase
MTESTTEPQFRRPHDPENLIGRLIAGRYLIRRCISQGGMGVIYLARQEALDRDVIVKVVRSDLAFEENEARFRREARSLSMLSHPNVVQIFDHGFDDESRLWFIVMEFVRGITLSHYRRLRGGILSTEEFLPIATQMLEGVVEAHRVGLLHRDLKPSNVMLTSPDGTRLGVKILDFGLSKLASNEKEQVTRTSYFAGSVMYLAPELIKNTTVDARADVYSLGVIFYQMLTGQNPLQGEDPYQLLLEQVTVGLRPMQDRLPTDHGVPPGLVELVNECTAIASEHRPASVQVVLERLLHSTQHIAGDTTESAKLAASAQALQSTELGSISGASRPLPVRPPAPQGPVRWTLWLAVGSITTVILLMSATLLVLVGLLASNLMREPEPPAAQVQEQAPVSVAAAEALRHQALMAIREGDYDRAVTLTTEAMALSPGGDGDLEELLEIVTDLRDRSRAAEPSEPPGGQPTPDRTPQPAPSPRPGPTPGPRASTPAVGIAIVTSTPPGLTFEIAGVVRGQTPFRALDIPAGPHDVTFYRDGAPVRTVQVTVPRGGVELVDVELETAAVQAPAPPLPAPPQPAAPDDARGPSTLYVYVPSSSKPRVVQDGLRAQMAGVEVTGFGSFRELKEALQTERPHAVIAPREVLSALGLAPTLQGRDSAGSTTERYLLLGTRSLSGEDLENVVIGTIDVAGRESSAEFVTRLLQTESAPQIKRVSEELDLLSMLQVGAADAVLLPESSARSLASQTQMKLVETSVAAGAPLPALAVLDDARRDQLEAAVRGLGPEINAKVGVNRWGD